MAYQDFSNRARKMLQWADREARRCNHEYIGTEHLLLGLVREGSGVAANVLKNLKIDLRKIRLEIEKIIIYGPDAYPMGVLPKTPRAQSVIKDAIEEARNLQHPYVGTEHLLLGLLREQEGLAAQILMNLGLTLEGVREEVQNLLGHGLHAPAHVLQEVKILHAQIYQLHQTKVAAAEFERAAHLPTQADRLEQTLISILGPWRERAKLLAEVHKSGSNNSAALARAVLDGDWGVVPILADALEENGDPRAAELRAWAEADLS
jgi:ATP-dependent Clp protease ATP-binding subunit ClpA